MKPPDREEGQVPYCPAGGRAGAQTPLARLVLRQPGRGRVAGWQPGREGPLSPQFPPPRQRRGRTLLTPPLRRSLPASTGTSTTPQQRGISWASRSAAGRRHRAGKARRAVPRSECPALAGTPRRPGSASAPTRRARLQLRIAVPAKTPPLAP